MMSTPPDSIPILASDGATIPGLHLGARADGSPVLLGAASIPVAPWEVELVRWPLEVETELRCGGYLSFRPTDTELWRNCADGDARPYP